MIFAALMRQGGDSAFSTNFTPEEFPHYTAALAPIIPPIVSLSTISVESQNPFHGYAHQFRA
jgi:hypothetical protein